MPARRVISFFFFFNDTATTEIYTLSLHDALPIFAAHARFAEQERVRLQHRVVSAGRDQQLIFRVARQDHVVRSEEHTSELQSPCNLVCRLLLEKKKKITKYRTRTVTAHSITSDPD